MLFRSSHFLPLSAQFQEAQVCSEKLKKGFDESVRLDQLTKLQSVWQDCIADVPYYKDLVANGKAPQKIDSWETFKQLPVLDRITVKENLAKLRRLSGAPDSYFSTAGSTGQPIILGEWKNETQPLRVAKLVPWIRLGYKLDSRLFLIWGHAHLLGTGWRRYYNHCIRKMKDWLAGYYRVDAYTINKQKAKQIAQDILKIKPTGLIGYAAALDLLCRYTHEYHTDFRKIGVQFVMSCAEPPPRSDTFELIQSVFGCPIVQEFGGVDFGHVGFKVDNDPYTIFPQLNILEVESDRGDMFTGNALVTTLYRRYVPLIRYRQGDVICDAKLDDSNLVVSFKDQIGRVNDMIELDDGTSVHSVALVHCFKDEAPVINVQLQLTDEGSSFSLIVDKSFSKESEKRIRHKLAQIHPQFQTAIFKYVSDLETNRAGKRRWVVDKRANAMAGQ